MSTRSTSRPSTAPSRTHHYKSRAGVAISVEEEQLPHDDAIEPLIDALDERRGASILRW
jgi:hypothetical protein